MANFTFRLAFVSLAIQIEEAIKKMLVVKMSEALEMSDTNLYLILKLRELKIISIWYLNGRSMKLRVCFSKI